MTDAEKAALLEYFERLSRYAAPADRHYYAALSRALAEPRLPKEPGEAALTEMFQAAHRQSAGFCRLGMASAYRALYAHLTKPHVDFAALDEARMDDSSGAGACALLPKEFSRGDLGAIEELLDREGYDLSHSTIRAVRRAFYDHLTTDYGRGSKAAGGKSHDLISEHHNCTPAARDDLRKAISVLRGWSAEAAGRTGLQPAVRMVCNAAEATLPKTMVRIRGQLVSGENFDFLALLPVSQSEVPQ